MSVEYFNNFQQEIDSYPFDDYLNNYSLLNDNKKVESLSSSSFFLQDKPLFKDSNEKVVKQEKYIPYSLPPLLNKNDGMKGTMLPNMLPNFLPMMMQQQQQQQSMMPMMQNKQQPKKRKSLAETTQNALNNVPLEEIEESPVKKNKKTKSASKKKKDSPKRKRVNYCFEIHRSGCPLNKDSKLYCKVFLKGKLQSEVDLIKGARGKWAYTFYDQRKKKKERRYWPSQSSGPVIEDPCSCENCLNGAIPTPTIGHHHHIIEEEVDFSSPSTEEGTFVEYDPPVGQFIDQYAEQNVEYQMNLMQQPYYDQGQIVYQNNNGQQMTYSDQQFYHGQMEQSQYPFEYPKTVALKSSNDFQDRNNNNYYLKSSNDYVNTHQRQWEANNIEYNNDGFFAVESNFL